jgi:hypothetical protein
MNETIRIQHYVPRFYLANFSIQRKHKFLIHVFDKTTSRSFETNIENIAAEKFFYDTKSIRPNLRQLVERLLSRMESRFAISYDKIVRGEDLSKLSLEEKASVAYFIVTQELRTREYRETMSDIMRQLRHRLSGERLSEELDRQLRDGATEESIKSVQAAMLFKDGPEFAGIIGAMNWILLRNRTDTPYWTSDHPVNRHNDIDQSPLGNLGLLSPGIQLFFPLSPRLALFIFDPAMYTTSIDKYDITDTQNVIFQNSLQVRWSTRHVFSVNDDFSLATDVIQKMPSVRDIKRKRFIEVK